MMEDGLTFATLHLDGADRFVPLRRLLGVTSFGMNLIVLQPGQRGRIHTHQRQEEVYLVLEGTLSLRTGEGTQELGKHELVRVGPAVRRQLVNRGPGRCVTLALGAAEPHEGRDGIAFTSWDETEGASPQDVPLPEDLPAGELRSA